MGDKDKPYLAISCPIIIPIPKNPIIDPKTSFLVTFSFKKSAAKIKVKIGRVETIIPAFRAEVKVNPRKKNEILNVIPENAQSASSGKSSFLIFSLL